MEKIGVVGHGPTNVGIAEAAARIGKAPLCSVPPLVARLVEAGLIGRTSGRAFHAYEPAPTARTRILR